MTIINSWWWSYLAKEHREKNIFDFTNDELNEMWDDDAIDIKTFTYMEAGPARDAMRRSLVARRDWYIQQRLNDWAGQIDIALWIDEGERSGRAQT